ncbi:hypothetical protein ACEPAF_802 [Sanghuangporus sanghuang]
MNVARLLQDSPSDDRDRLRRQESRDRQDREREREQEEEREREWEREREIARERDEWERSREWDRDRERQRSTLSSTSSVPQPAHRSYSPLESALPSRSHIHAYDNKQPTLPPPPRPTGQSQGTNHAYAHSHSPSSEAVHTRSYSQDGHPSSSTHSHSHSPPAPLFLSPLTAPAREGTAAGPVPGSTLSTEYSAEYAHRAKNSSQQARDGAPSALSRLDQDRDREYRQRAHSLSGSGRPRTPPYGDYGDAGHISPTTARLGSKQHSPAQGSYSVVPPSPSHPQREEFSPSLSSSLNSNNINSASPLPRAHSNQAAPSSRRPPPPPPTSLQPPPSASLSRSHDSTGAPTSSAMSRSFDERPYMGRAPSSSSSSVMSAGRERERTLKEDIEREREAFEREQREQRQRERERGRELEHNARSRSASGSAGAQIVLPDGNSDREREMAEYQRMKDMDAIRAVAETRMQSQPRDARERDAQRHHHHHYHHHPLSHSHSHPQLSQNTYPQHQKQPEQQPRHQQQHQSSLPPPIPGTPYTYAHTGKPRISRSGVLKLAPPGVTVPNNVPPSSSDMTFAGAPGVVIRQETLTLAPPSHVAPTLQLQLRQEQQHPQQQQQQSAQGPSGSSGPQPIEPIPVDVKQRSPPAMTLHNTTDMHGEGPQVYKYLPYGHDEDPHSFPHPQQHPPPTGKHKYSTGPTGAGVPPPGSGPPPPGNLHPSMMSVQQQQQQQQHSHQFGSMQPPHQVHHQQSLPPPHQSRPSSSANGLHGQGQLHANPYRHMPSGLPPQNYPPPPMQYNEVPPPPVPMALQPMPHPSPPPRELTPAERPLYLGTYVFPRIPFPYFFPSWSEMEMCTLNVGPGQSKKVARREAELAADHKDRPTHVTILVPSAHLPSSLPTDGRSRIWGGAPLSIPNPWVPYVNYMSRSHGANARRIYTDDSDLVLCALHSGRISWAGLKRARAAGLDLSIRFALHRDVGRYIGGPSAFADGSVVEGSPNVDVGLKRSLEGKSLVGKLDNMRSDGLSWLAAQSASWDSGHDGSGIEVISTEWLPRGSARKLGLRNRSQRLKEYAERRRVIMKEVVPEELVVPSRPSATVLGKRSALLQELSCNTLTAIEDDQSTSRTVVFGKCHEVESAGLFGTSSFKYDPVTVRSVLFPPMSVVSSAPSERERPRGRRKRRKVNSSSRDDDDLQSEPGTDGRRSPSPRRTGRGIILENSEERFLLALRDTANRTYADKENRVSSLDGADGSGVLRRSRRSYNLFFLPLSSIPSVLLASEDSTAGSESGPVANGNGVQKTDVGPMTPKSIRSETGSPRDVGKKLDTLNDTTTAGKGAGRTDARGGEGLPSKMSTKTVPMPTPPATTETEHPPSPSFLNDDTVKSKTEGAKAPLVLCRDVGEDNVHFSDDGLLVLGAGHASSDYGAGKEEGALAIRVDRWRFAGSRDSAALKNLPSRDDAVAGLGVVVS